MKIMMMIALAVCCFSVSCAKLSEDVRQERIPRPTIDVGEITPPDWDDTVENPNQIGNDKEEDTK